MKMRHDMSRVEQALYLRLVTCFVEIFENCGKHNSLWRKQQKISALLEKLRFAFKMIDCKAVRREWLTGRFRRLLISFDFYPRLPRRVCTDALRQAWQVIDDKEKIVDLLNKVPPEKMRKFLRAVESAHRHLL